MEVPVGKREALAANTPRLPNNPAEFVQNHLNEDIHPVFARSSSHYIRDLDLFGDEEEEEHARSLKPWEGTDAERDNLCQAIADYERKAKGKNGRPRTAGEIRASSATWGEIMDEIGTTMEQCQYRGRMYNAMRRLREHAPAFEQWVGCLPQGDYSGIIRQVMFTIRLRGDADNCQSGLQIGIAEESAKAILKGTEYEKKLEMTLKAVENAVDRVKTEAGFIAMDISVCFNTSNHRLLQKIDVRQGRFESKIDDVIKILQMATSDALNAAYNQFRGSPLFDPVTGISYERMKGSEAPYSETPNTTASPRSSAKQHSTSISSYPPKDAGINIDQVLKSLNFSPIIPHEDLLDQVGLSGCLEPSQQDRAKEVMTSNKLRLWLQSPSSSTLLIQSNGAADDVTDPLAFIASKILSFLQSQDAIIASWYFCSLHCERADNARSLIASILGQLLSHSVFRHELRNLRLPKLAHSNLPELLAEKDLSALLDVFSHVLQHLPYAMAFICVIDGLSLYENRDRSGDTIEVVRFLVKCGRRQRGLTFKLLLTCPNGTPFVREYGLSEAETLLLEEDLVDGDGQGYDDIVLEEDLSSVLED